MPSDRPRTRERPTAQRPTLATIAARLGVSRATVSNAYNRPDQLSAELRDRVLEAAAAVGYAGPDPAARSLRKGRVGAVGYLLCDRLSYAFSDPAALAFADGLAEALEPEGAGLLILPSASGSGPSPDVVRNAVVDGLVVYALSDDDPALAAARERSVPLVVVDQAGRPEEGVVRIDDRGGAAAIAQHLVELGHRSPAVLSFEMQRDRRAGFADSDRMTGATWAVVRERLAGYRSVFEAAGVDWAAVPVWECPYNGRQPGRDAVKAVLTAEPRTTAIVALSDELALGAIEGARDLGIEVPRDLSVVGFDDAPAAATATPPLTTVHQPLRRKGLMAGKHLLEVQSGQRPTRSRRLPTELVVRSSTGPPPPRPV